MLGQAAGGAAHAQDGHKWRILATACLEKLESWKEFGAEWNFSQKYILLRAELSALDGDGDTAIVAYDDAILMAGEHSYINEQALTCERAGLFYLERGIMMKGKENLMRAKQLYHTWGAGGNLADLDHLLEQRCSTSV